ncbi:MAG: hypothetical protein JWM93_1988, partial [Frankiales bacterium]|nr:hypothetical protein [Frankiales bacterium]
SSYELPGSGTNGYFLDSSPTGLTNLSKNSPVRGRYAFAVRNGFVLQPRLAKPRLDVLLLGDSYSAGNGSYACPTSPADALDCGNGVAEYYGPSECMRSHYNWAEKYVAKLREKYTVFFTNRACSGGVAANVTSSKFLNEWSAKYLFAGERLSQSDAYQRMTADINACNQNLPNCGGRYCGTNIDDEFRIVSVKSVVYQPRVRTQAAGTIASYDCRRNLHAQVTNITPETDLVLLSMGGNDIEFAKLINRCFVLDVGLFGIGGNEADCEKQLARSFSLANDTIFSRSAAMLQSIAARLHTNAKVVLNSYPYLSEDKPGYYRTVDNGRGGSHRVYLANEIRRLGRLGDDLQQRATATLNNRFVEVATFYSGTKATFAGHEPNPSKWERNGSRWIWEIERANKLENYHPRRQGHLAWGLDMWLNRGTFDARSS